MAIGTGVIMGDRVIVVMVTLPFLVVERDECGQCGIFPIISDHTGFTCLFADRAFTGEWCNGEFVLPDGSVEHVYCIFNVHQVISRLILIRIFLYLRVLLTGTS